MFTPARGQGRQEQATTLLSRAQTAYAASQTESDPARRRTLLEETRRLTAEAARIQGFREDTRGLRMRVADEAGVLARITGILAENGISIDAVLQRESADGEKQTDLIILTHDTEEGRMNLALAQLQALPTVLAPIVRIRKEELA